MWRFGESGALREGMGALHHVPMPYSRHLFPLAVPESVYFYDKLVL